ncbi:MAG: recombinase family protein [Clostridia bacterium]
MMIRKLESKCSQRKKRVAAYARVSTEAEEQKESFDTQIDYYTRFIRQNPAWVFVEVYADAGCSGNSADHRPNFKRMLADAAAGKLDIILVKSISRFARNVADAHRYVHELKEHGVEVCFEREGISSVDPCAEMVFSVLSAVAQEESRSISENVKWSYRKLAEKGIRRMGNHKVLGYDENADGVLIPNRDAWIVKRTFELFIRGTSLAQIARSLTAEGANTLHGKGGFTGKAVQRMVRNEIYVGDRKLQKHPPTHYLTKKPDLTLDYNSFYITEAHEGIVSRRTWNLAQGLIAQTKADISAGIHRTSASPHFLYGRVFCGECGAPYTRRTQTNRDGTLVKAWNCRERQKGYKGNGCKNVIIKEKELLEAIAEQLGMERFDEAIFLATAERLVVSKQGIVRKSLLE